jgi:hypothetical protein
LGDIIRSGLAGSTTTGGASGSDFEDPDTLWLGGYAKTQPATTASTTGAQPLFLPAYGSGGGTDFNSGPFAGDGRGGSPGVAVLEFYNLKPY